MSRFTEHAERILAVAESAVLRGEACTEMTILIGRDDGIQILADSDWPLDSLAAHHGAKAAYRVTQQNGKVRVEGHEGHRSCLLVGQAVRFGGLLDFRLTQTTLFVPADR